MNALLDQINEAYYYQSGYSFGQKVRERIHWICAQTKGKKVLDIGCSQGITSILLGKEGKKVLGIDVSQEAIEYANRALMEAPYDVQNAVRFERADFLIWNFGNEKYDTIIMGEILEHLVDYRQFFNKAKGLLSEDGRIIVTVPFGINDYSDHKHTFYISGLLDLADESLQMVDYKIFGKWIGAIYERRSQDQSEVVIDKVLLQQLEEYFYRIERNLYNQIHSKELKIKELEQAIEEEKKNNYLYQKEISLKIEQLTKTVNEQNTNVQKIREEWLRQYNDQQYEKQKQRYEEELSELSDRVSYMTRKLISLTTDKIEVEQQLLQAYEKEEKLLKAHRKLMLRYQALSNSKLGRLTLLYWKLIKRFKWGR
ncbi:class I SAM-dependent methyltransferase [Geobacillus thermodenitrificans]|uniref:class I SAM-dependent methyltransferase n=1 Tax=Geobacillus thermodenitrificans TaxID=33940 RepID=UPI002E082270|nr:2-polyprenyl-6-hydroxyphenyl methylase/3-demethylubiquinone-9 3-methyltransferase [Geobacillus thermodenitrificans]MED0663281.1 hypothetical protein [Geobacillus thermodenitrificans]